MSEVFFYELNQWFLFSLAIGLLYLFAEVGFRYGILSKDRTTEATHSHVATIEGALLGMLALLLGFAFAMAMSRFDHRREVVVEEANDLQTTYLRAQLLREPYAAASSKLLLEYLDTRIEYYKAGVSREEIRTALEKTDQIQVRLWGVAVSAARDNSDEVRTGYYIESLNRLIDDHTKRLAAMENHVPEVILHLLFFVAAMTLGVTGFSAGLRGKRLLALRAILIFLVCATLIVIIDLDRPRRGFIRVSEGQLVKLQQTLESFRVDKVP